MRKWPARSAYLLPDKVSAPPRVSVIVPARNEATFVPRVIQAVLAQRPAGIELEVIVVDDGSTDGTAEAAGAAGDPLIFLDADCIPAEGWLAAILAAHDAGATVVGGALDLPPGLPATARCDYYCGWYLVHSRRPAGV